MFLVFLAANFFDTIPTALALSYIALPLAQHRQDSGDLSLPTIHPPHSSSSAKLLNRRINCRGPLHESQGYQCGVLYVPLDWQNPTLGRGRVYYAKYPASPGVVRKGTIFVDTGV